MLLTHTETHTNIPNFIVLCSLPSWFSFLKNFNLSVWIFCARITGWYLQVKKRLENIWIILTQCICIVFRNCNNIFSIHCRKDHYVDMFTSRSKQSLVISLGQAARSRLMSLYQHYIDVFTFIHLAHMYIQSRLTSGADQSKHAFDVAVTVLHDHIPESRQRSW